MKLDELLTAITALTVLEVDDIEAALEDRKFALGIGRYSQAKIYLVRHLVTGVVAYVGSTIKPLEIRWGGHRGFFKHSPNSIWSMYVNDNGGPEQFAIELVKEYPCRTFNDLLQEERRQISELNPVCNVFLRTSVDELPDRVVMTDKQSVTYQQISDMSNTEYNENKRDIALASYQKYWFTNISPFGEIFKRTPSSLLFDGIVFDKRRRKQFVWAVLTLRPEWAQSLRDCPWIKFKVRQRDEEVVHKVSKLAQDLGLANVYQQSSLSDKTLLHTDNLHEYLTDLKTALNLRVRHPKEITLSTLRLYLGSVLNAFCCVTIDTKREKTSKGKKENGKRQYLNSYDFQIVIKDQFLNEVLKLLQ